MEKSADKRDEMDVEKREGIAVDAPHELRSNFSPKFDFNHPFLDRKYNEIELAQESEKGNGKSGTTRRLSAAGFA
jgi:hypothetical protein